MHLEWRDMTKVRPDCETEISKCDWFVVLDEEYLSCCSLGGEEILSGKNMGMGYIPDVGDIPQIQSISNDIGSFSLSYTSVNRWNELIVSWSTQD
jgi:hypothetical protein